MASARKELLFSLSLASFVGAVVNPESDDKPDQQDNSTENSDNKQHGKRKLLARCDRILDECVRELGDPKQEQKDKHDNDSRPDTDDATEIQRHRSSGGISIHCLLLVPSGKNVSGTR